MASANGDDARVNVGDRVCRHDPIEPTIDGAAGISFTDGTAFNLSQSRLHGAERIRSRSEQNSNSTRLKFNQGVTFTFTPGKTTKAGGLRIDTPVGRIRGSAREGGLGILTLAGLTFSVLDQIQAASQAPHGFLDDGAVTVANQSASRSHAFLDDDRLTYKHLPHGGYEITMRDATGHHAR